MTISTKKISIISEFGDEQYPSELTFKMDSTKPDCPITFYIEGCAVFSLGSEEIVEFCDTISKLVP